MYIWTTNFDVADRMMKIIEEPSMSPGIKEGFSRAIVHQAYYACFHKTKENNERFSLSSNMGGNDSHNNVIDNILFYPEIDKGKLKAAKSNMKQLKEYRRQADYVSNQNHNQEKVSCILKIAKETFNDISNF